MTHHVHRIAAALLLTAAAIAACNNDPYQAGFHFIHPQQPVTAVYANATADSLVVQCYGPWQITTNQQWATIDQMRGKGSAVYALGVHFKPNTTGLARTAEFTIRDSDHPDEAYTSWLYHQYATRGDGTLGGAPLVRTITATDGYKATIGYDDKARPTDYTLVNSLGGVDEQLTIAYDEQRQRITVSRSGISMSGAMDQAFQPTRLEGPNDTVGYYNQYYTNGMPMPLTDAFNFVAANTTKGLQAWSYLIGGKSLNPDSLHTADSLRYVRQWRGSQERHVEQLRLAYSHDDNRHQSIDPNQLILGFAECNPLQLLSLFRFTRSTSIISEAHAADGVITITTQLNADKSISTMTVADSRHNTAITYTFGY